MPNLTSPQLPSPEDPLAGDGFIPFAAGLAALPFPCSRPTAYKWIKDRVLPPLIRPNKNNPRGRLYWSKPALREAIRRMKP
jgi:hypothetical protein